MGDASTKQHVKSLHDCVVLSLILLLYRTFLPPAKSNSNQNQIIFWLFSSFLLIFSILFQQGYKGYPGPPGHPGDQVSFASFQHCSFRSRMDLLAPMLVWMLYRLLGAHGGCAVTSHPTLSSARSNQARACSARTLPWTL